MRDIQHILLESNEERLIYAWFFFIHVQTLLRWHVGHCNEAYLPLSRGFDDHFGFLTGGVDYVSKAALGEITPFDFFIDNKPCTYEEYGQTFSGVRSKITVKKSYPLKLYWFQYQFNDRITKLLAENAPKARGDGNLTQVPMFMMMALQTPHSPFNAVPDEFVQL